MIYQNIFSKKPVQSSTRLHFETEDFDYTNRLLENESLLEDNFFDIVRDQMMVIHLATKENSPEILQEGFKDFMTSAKEFFENMLEKFKEFMNKVFMYLHAYLGNFEKFLTKYAESLKQLDPDFQIEGYEYTFDNNIPNIDNLHTIVSSYNSELSSIETMSKADVMNKRKQYLSSETLNTVRATTIGVSTPIRPEEYLSTVKKLYRNGEDKPQSIVVNKARLQQAISDYTELKKLREQCMQDRNKTIALVDSLKNFFNRKTSVHYKDQTKVMYVHNLDVNDQNRAVIGTEREDIRYNGSRMEVINLYYSFKFSEAKEIGSIATIATIEKTHALKEAIQLSQSIIRKSLGFKKSPTEAVGLEGGTN